MRALRRRLLAGARRRARVPAGVRRGADGLGPAGGADPARSTAGSGSGSPTRASCSRRSTARAASAAACHAQMYTMGALLRHGSEAQKREYLPRIASGELRLQAFSVTEAEAGSDTTSIATTARRDGDEYVVDGHKNWTSRIAQSDLLLLLARTAERDEHARSAGLSLFLVDLREVRAESIEVTQVRTMFNYATNEVRYRGLRIPAASPDRRGGRGLPLRDRRLERRAHPARRGGDRRRLLVHRPGQRLRRPARGVRPPDRRQPGRAVPDRPRLHAGPRRRPDALRGGAALRRRRALRRRGQHGQAAELGGELGRRRCVS